jgi:transcriptional regulator with XRE-family HTH domain
MQAPIRGRKAGTYRLHGLKALRERREWSIRELANLAELSPDTIWRLESLDRGAEPKTRRALARALGTTIGELKRPPDEENLDD